MYPDKILNLFTLYGVCIAIGILVCILVLRYLGKKTNINAKFLDFVEFTGYVAILMGWFTSWIFQAFYDYVKTGEFVLKDGGFTFIGGLIGGVGTFILVYVLFKKKLTGRIADMLPIAPCCITVAHAFGRIGCFFAGCCGGIRVDEGDPFYFLAIKFPHHSYAQYPTQLFESIFLFILCGIMIFLVLKKKFKYNFVVYLGGYGVWRYLIEFIRGDERGQIFSGVDWLSPSQFWSILMVLLTVPIYFLLKYLYKNRDKEISDLAVDTEVK